MCLLLKQCCMLSRSLSLSLSLYIYIYIYIYIYSSSSSSSSKRYGDFSCFGSISSCLMYYSEDVSLIGESQVILASVPYSISPFCLVTVILKDEVKSFTDIICFSNITHSTPMLFVLILFSRRFVLTRIFN